MTKMIQKENDMSNEAQVPVATTANGVVHVTITPSNTITVTTEAMVATTLAAGIDDPALTQAALNAFQTGSLTPLIKEELRCTIQNKRLIDGKEELEVEYKSRRSEKLTPEEETRRHRRRERNKVAAQRCRGKRKTLADELEKESQDLEEANSELKNKVETLEMEKKELERMLLSHDACASRQTQSCSMRLSTSTISEDEDVLDLMDVMDGVDEDQVVS